MEGILIQLRNIVSNHPCLKADMQNHYSQPKGFVGRRICYGIYYDGTYYGSIVAGSATLHLPGREIICDLNNGINNIFYHLRRVNDKYPCRDFARRVLRLFMEKARVDWLRFYGDPVYWFETLVELPRTGDIYKRSGWREVGLTKGYTCKRKAGKSTDSWTGKREWDTENLRPKRVFYKEIFNAPT